MTGSGYNTVKWIVDDLVYGKELDYTIADNEHLYTVVPKGVIKKYVADKEQRRGRFGSLRRTRSPTRSFTRLTETP